MNTQNELDDQEDVVVIEQRDKRTYVYIIIALIVGLAVGGLIGSTMTANKWKATLSRIEGEYKNLQLHTSELVTTAKNKVADADKESQQKMEQALKDQADKYLAEISKLKTQVTEVEKVNMSLEEQVSTQKQKIDASEKTISKLDSKLKYKQRCLSTRKNCSKKK